MWCEGLDAGVCVHVLVGVCVDAFICRYINHRCHLLILSYLHC